MVLARARAQQEASKSLFGKPKLKYGQCYAMAGYFMQLGALLGAKHRDKPDAFGHAFLGATGEPGAVKRFFTDAAPRILEAIAEDMTFTDYVNAEQVKRLKYTGDPHRFLFDLGMKRLT